MLETYCLKMKARNLNSRPSIIASQHSVGFDTNQFELSLLEINTYTILTVYCRLLVDTFIKDTHYNSVCRHSFFL